LYFKGRNLNHTDNETFIFISLLTSVILSAQTSSQPLYLNPDLPLEERLDDLVSRMTLEEKAAQMLDQAEAIPRLATP